MEFIKNLKIYTKKKGKKLKLQFTSICLVIVMIVSSGCSFFKKNNEKTSINDNTLTTEDSFDRVYNSANNSEIGSVEQIDRYFNSDFEIDELSNTIINSKIKISKDETLNSVNDISNLIVDYRYSELYNVDQFMLKYSQVKNNSIIQQENAVIKNGKIDLDVFYNIVIKNNFVYLKNNSGIAKKYSDTSDDFVYKICSIMVNYLNDYIHSNNLTDIDINNLDYKLSNLKIFNSDTFSYAYFNPDTVILGVSSNSVEAVKKTSEDELAFEKIVEHECGHIIQAGCDIEFVNSNCSMRFGPCYKFKDLDVNCGYWNWFYEATAESMVSNYHNAINSLTYAYEIQFLESLKVATIFNTNTDVNDLEKISKSNDLEDIFNYFDCNTEQDKKELIKMMYSFNIISTDSYSSSTNDFYEEYSKKYGKNMDYNERYDFEIELASSVSQSMSKIFYKNLYRQLGSQEVKVEDIFQNIMVFENEISRFLKYYDYTRINYIEDFFKNYLYVQELLFESISKKLNINLSDVKNAYVRYNANFHEVNISYLTSDKNNFYNYILESRSYYKKLSISEIYNDFKLDKSR